VMIVDGGKADRWIRLAAFWIAIAATRVMPVRRAFGASPLVNGPQVMANVAAELSRRIFRTTADSRTGHPGGANRWTSVRASTITTKNPGGGSSFATPRGAPGAGAAPRVTKSPVTWEVKSPWSPRKPAVST